jgi:hypothetical protein
MEYKAGDRVMTSRGEGVVSRVSDEMQEIHVRYSDGDACWFREHEVYPVPKRPGEAVRG